MPSTPSTPSWLYGGSIVLALSTLLLIATGSYVTADVLDPAAHLAPIALFGPGGHQLMAVVTGVLGLLIAGVLIFGKGSPVVGWMIVALILADGGLGSFQEKLRPLLPLLHASLAQLLFAAITAAVVVTSPGWKQEPEPIADAGWPSLRSFGRITPPLIFAQIVLGAMFRHQAIGILSHIAGAIVVAILILITGMCVIQQCPEHRSLKPAAVLLLVMAFVQVFLGIGSISMAMMNPATAPSVLIAAAIHVVGGALTLGASVVLALQIRRHVRAAASS